MVLAMLHASNNDFAKFWNVVGNQIVGGVPIAGRGLSKALFNSPSNRRFWMVGQDDEGRKRVYAASPGTLVAESFVIEKV